MDSSAGRVWPSEWWVSHACAERRRCPHRLPTPGWWLLMAKRGLPYDADAERAMQMAKERIAVYRGQKQALNREQQEFVQGLALDALVVAPQPVGPGWVNTTVMAIGRLTQWAVVEGEPLEREHLLSSNMRNRFLNLGCSGMKEMSVRNLRCRLDLVAAALSGAVVTPSTTMKRGSHDEVTTPHTAVEVATLWMWVQGLRPITRRERLRAAFVLAVGCGLTSKDIVRVLPEHVRVDVDGVHVQVVTPGKERVVTCARVWEDRLVEVVTATPAGCPVASPWRGDATTARMLQNAVRGAQISVDPPVLFSVQSLRNTWLVDRLSAGTPVPTLMNAAGLTVIEALRGFLPYVPTPAQAERALSLRGEG